LCRPADTLNEIPLSTFYAVNGCFLSPPSFLLSPPSFFQYLLYSVKDFLDIVDYILLRFQTLWVYAEDGVIPYIAVEVQTTCVANRIQC